MRASSGALLRSIVASLLALALAGCGSAKKPQKGTAEPGGRGIASCVGSALASPPLPAGFPLPGALTLTGKGTLGPTTTLDGYFAGTIREGHDAFKSGFESAGYTILFDEVEEHDSEVSWQAKGRSGQVALRDECKQKGKVAVHITNRPSGT